MSEKGFKIAIPHQYSEFSLDYAHGYEDGFTGRAKSVQRPLEMIRRSAYDDGYKMGKEVGDTAARLMKDSILYGTTTIN